MDTTTRSSSVTRLLVDASLLRDYLAAAGLLDTSALDEGIIAVNAATSASDEASASMRLRSELSRAVNLAKPYISLIDLRAGKSPFAYGRIAKLRQFIQPILVSSFALIAIFGTVLGFAIVQDVARDIAELQGILAQEPLKKLSDLRRLISEGALKDPKSGYYSQYQKAANDLTLLFESANEVTTRTMSTVPIGASTGGLLGKIFHVLQAEVAGARPPSNQPVLGGALSDLTIASNTEASIGSTVDARMSDAVGLVTPVPMATAAHRRINVSSPDPESFHSRDAKTSQVLDLFHSCKPYNTDPVKTLYGAKNAQFLAAALDRFDDYCLAQTLDINTGQYTTTGISNTIRALQDELFVIGVLFLPMVGGLLGASIFVVQFLLNNRLTPTISPVGIAFRIISGGAFGVVIGWFASSAIGGSSSESVQHITGTPFTLAVIAGFSIDTLSKVLLKYTAKAQVTD